MGGALKRFFISKFNRKEDFRSKVEKIIKEEKDFRSLYDYNKIGDMDEEAQKQYLYEITKDYLRVRDELLSEKTVKKVS